MRAASWVALSVFRESVRDRVPYNLVLFAVLLIALVVPARPAHGGAGRQDHQGSRARGDRCLRPVHRDLHRHRPGIEGSRAAQHLLAAVEAGQPRAVHRGQVRRPRADACGQRRGDDGRALRRARLHDVDASRPSSSRRGMRRASIPRLLKAIFLIFVELMLVTAVALFFSTFSTPLLSAALTFGLYVAGHFNADLRNFDQVVSSQPAAWLARGALSRAARPVRLRRQDRRSSTACRSSAGYVLSTTGYGAGVHRGAAAGCDGHLLAAGLQVSARRASCRSPGRCSALATRRGAAGRPRRARTRSEAARQRAAALRALGRRREAHGPRVRRAGRRRLLDPGHPALRRRPARCATDAGEYELLYPLLDLTTTLDPYFTIAYRFGAIFLSEAPPGGPGRPDQAIALLRRGSRRSRRSGSTSTTSRSSITGTCTTRLTAANWFQRAAAQPDAPNWLRPLAATMLSARRSERRRGSCGSRSSSPTRRGCGGPRSGACCSSRRSIRSTSCRRSCCEPICRPGAG